MTTAQIRNDQQRGFIGKCPFGPFPITGPLTLHCDRSESLVEMVQRHAADGIIRRQIYPHRAKLPMASERTTLCLIIITTLMTNRRLPPRAKASTEQSSA